MCLHVQSKEFTAKEDIKVYKVIQSNKKSFFRGFKYKPNTLYRLRKKLKIVNSEIHEGFHSFRQIPSYYMSMEWGIIVKFTIPKGAKYYLGKKGDIVSTSIKSGNLRRISRK